MSIKKKILRKLVLPVSFSLGLDQLMKGLNPNGLINIMYHGVVKNDSTFFSPRNIDVFQFERQIQYIKRNFDVISCKEAFEYRKAQKKWMNKTVTICFDDGLKNNLDVALPILEYYNIPATFFISTCCLLENETNCVWAEKIAALRYFYKNQNFQLGNYNFENFICVSTNQSIEDFFKSCNIERDELLQDLDNKFDLSGKLKTIDCSIWELMSKNDVLQLMASKIVEIGSHGHNHFNLGNIPIEYAEMDLKTSKSYLEMLAQQTVDMIAYPDGSYNEKVLDIAESLGYRYQFAVNYQTEKDKNDYRLMNRFSVSSTTTFESNILRLNHSF